MTQPPVPGSSRVPAFITAAALGLALIALEQQTRDDIAGTVQTLYRGLAGAAIVAASAAPASVVTGLGLLSIPSFYRTTSGLFDAAHINIGTTVRSSYDAAAQLARTKLYREIDAVPVDLPDLGTGLNSLLADVDTMIGDARTRFHNLVQSAYRPGDPQTLLRAILTSDGNLTQRATAAATTAAHRGSSDAHQAVFSHLQTATGQALLKRWRTTSANPCGMCEALNGTEVGINAEFNPRASTNEADLRPAWRGHLTGPPRHPNCRCQLELVAVPQ